MVKGPTQMTNSTSIQIDVIFSDRPERITKSRNIITGLSDHNMVLKSRKLTSRQFTTHAGIPKKQPQRPRSSHKNINWDDLLLENYSKTTSQTFTEKLQSINFQSR